VNYHQTIAKNIKSLCKSKKITYSELARRAGILLVSLQALLYNKTRKDPRISTVHKIAKALNVSIDKLVK
jgi:transcriptional regulator with XRE-family HTH domain